MLKLLQGNVNIVNSQGTSQPQTVVLGNQVIKVQPYNNNGTNTNQESKPTTSGQIILGSTLKVLKVNFL